MSSKEKLRDNLRALEISLKWKGGDYLFGHEIEELQKFHGWGGIKAVLMNPWKDEEWVSASEADKKLRGDVEKLYDLIGDNYPEIWKKIIDSIKAATLTSYYTPKVIPDTAYQVMREYADIKTVYDPSAGSGVFMLSAVENLPDIQSGTVVEKDILTGQVLKCLMSTMQIPVTVHQYGLEDTPDEVGHDIVTSNVPFGSIPVYDPQCTDRSISGKIHNYFVWKGLQKCKDGSILAVLISNTFLDSPSNKTARKYLYSNADHISVVVMPDSLYKDTGGTMAPSHYIVVRKRAGKREEDMSQEEKWLCEAGTVIVNKTPLPVNEYIKKNAHKCVIGKRRVGKNQYGKPAIEVAWDKTIEEISEPFRKILSRDMELRYKASTMDEWKKGIYLDIDALPKYSLEHAQNIMQLQSNIWIDDVPEHLVQYPLTVEESYTAEQQVPEEQKVEQLKMFENPLMQKYSLKNEKECQIMQLYEEIRDTYLHLESEESKIETNR